MTLFELKKRVGGALLCENADFEAQQIVLAALGLDLTSFLLKKGELAPREAVSFCDACVRRRNAGEPLYYILGKTEFYSLPFYVGEGVLIPRQDTETLVDEALGAIGSLPADTPIRVLDLCAGSGCVGISIAKFCPQCR
ncbi:MAG: N5-glutamine methyltransferase family protein, partial [Acutalibacteraceae bacterium]